MNRVAVHQIQNFPIGEFCETGSGGTPSRANADRYFGGRIPWVKSGELRESVITQTEESITEEGLNESAAKLLPPNTLLVALYGATVGRIGVLGIEAATNQAICHIIPDEKKANRTYLYYALQSKVPYWLSKRVGVGQPNISQGVIRDTEIPLPPLIEQRRIASILDKADALRRKRREAVLATRQLPLSSFSKTFEAYLKLAERVSVLSNVAEVVSGVAKGRRINGDDIREVPYLRVANVQAGYLDLSELKTIPATPAEIDALTLKVGDIVMTEGGDHDKLGRGALWRESISDCIHQNHVFRVRLDRDHVLPEFFVHFLQTQSAKGYFLRCAKKTTNLASINMTQLRGLPVPLPPLELQSQFVSELGLIDKIAQRQLLAARASDEAFTALVQRAFRGEL